MCGRFSQAYTWEEIFKFSQPLTAEPKNLQPRYNIAPTTDIDILVRGEDGRRKLIKARWGLIHRRHGDLKAAPVVKVPSQS